MGASEVYLFGSRAKGEAASDADIDLAVRGIPAPSFYGAVGEALCAATVRVDVIDLDGEGPFIDYLKRRGSLVRVV